MSSSAVQSLLKIYAPIFSARSAHLKTTLLAGKEGEIVASENVTLIDDPFYPEKFGHCPFDGEGVAVYAKNVIENGRLNTLLYNRMYAGLLGRETTGNAADATHIEPKGLYFAPGTLTNGELLQRLGDGLYRRRQRPVRRLLPPGRRLPGKGRRQDGTREEFHRGRQLLPAAEKGGRPVLRGQIQRRQ